MLMEFCLGLAALWSAYCPALGDVASRAGGSARLADTTHGALAPAANAHAAGVRHGPSGMVCYFDPLHPPRVEAIEGQPISCHYAQDDERLWLLAIPLEGSAGAETLIEMERQDARDRREALVTVRTVAEEGRGTTHILDWTRPDRRGFLAVRQRGAWLIAIRYETTNRHDEADRIIRDGVFDALR